MSVTYDQENQTKWNELALYGLNNKRNNDRVDHKYKIV